MGYQVVQLIPFDGRSLRRRLEWAGRQVPPIPAVNHDQYTPFRDSVPAESDEPMRSRVVPT